MAKQEASEAGWLLRITWGHLTPIPIKLAPARATTQPGAVKMDIGWTSRPRRQMRSSVAFGNVHWSQNWTWRHRIKILVKIRIRLRKQCGPDFSLLQGQVAKMIFSLGKFPVGNRFPSMNETGV